MEKFDSIFKSLKKEFCDDLIQGIRLDVWAFVRRDQLNGTEVAKHSIKNQIAFQNIQTSLNKEKSGVISGDIKKINEKILKKDEYYIYELAITHNTHYCNNYTSVYSLFAITNYSNMSYTTHCLNSDC